MAFDEALAEQFRARDEVISGGPGCVFTVEHPPALTIGRRGAREDVLWSDEQLAGAGVAMFDTPRGGQVTLHAPGQLVIYPVVHVGRRIRAHLETLAAVTIELLEGLGVADPRYRPNQPGVWVGEAKIASIGVHISRGVAVQGLSVNFGVDRSLFAALVSCGMPEVHMVNATEVGGRPLAIEDAALEWTERYANRVGLPIAWLRRPR